MVQPYNPELKAWADSQPAGTRIWWIGGLPWSVGGQILAPLAMPHQMAASHICGQEVSRALTESGALLARWTSRWALPEPTEWYYTIAQDPAYALERLESQRGKRGISKGLKECTVRRLEVEEFIALSFPIYRKSLAAYGHAPPDQVVYANQHRRRACFSGTEYWAAFVGDNLAAYATCLVLAQAVSLGTTKADDALLKANPNNALFFQICRHYLVERGMAYVSNGTRTLLHPTTINEFLERMGFTKCYARLEQVYSLKAKLVAASGVARWGRFFGLPRMLPRHWPLLAGFEASRRIAATFTASR